MALLMRLSTYDVFPHWQVLQINIRFQRSDVPILVKHYFWLGYLKSSKKQGSSLACRGGCVFWPLLVYNWEAHRRSNHHRSSLDHSSFEIMLWAVMRGQNASSSLSRQNEFFQIQKGKSSLVTRHLQKNNPQLATLTCKRWCWAGQCKGTYSIWKMFGFDVDVVFINLFKYTSYHV